jgi:hypothetical protein
MDGEIDVSLHCGVCGTDYNADGVSPAVNLGIMNQWRIDHQHTPGEIKMYQDAEIAVRQYQHSHPFQGDTDE